MSRHSFAELVRVFFALRQVGDEEMTQSQLARAIGVSGPTLNNWFTGKYLPRSPDTLDALALALKLTAFEADVLFHSVNPKWVKFGTPAEALERYEINRYRERFLPPPEIGEEPPLIAEIERDWHVAFKDSFTGNGNHWGLGTRNDGVCMVERSIAAGCYTLRLNNWCHWNVTVGGDSHCFAPPIYYLSVEARRLTGGKDEEDGYAVIFEEINDGCHNVFRIRDAVQCFSLYRAQSGGDQVTTHIDRTFHPVIRPRQTNTLALLASHEQHWFYINNVLVFSTRLGRIADTRLDVGIISGSAAPVVCEYRNFVVRVPAHMPFANGTPTLQ
jgi:transcriptional regulator with XRE-family HTH domain